MGTSADTEGMGDTPFRPVLGLRACCRMSGRVRVGAGWEDIMPWEDRAWEEVRVEVDWQPGSLEDTAGVVIRPAWVYTVITVFQVTVRGVMGSTRAFP